MFTKSDELKALESIKSILDKLPDDSYVRTAFKGCDIVARSNIEDDFLSSPYEEYCRSRDEIDELQIQLNSILNDKKTIDEKYSDLVKCVDSLTMKLDNIRDIHFNEVKRLFEEKILSEISNKGKSDDNLCLIYSKFILCLSKLNEEIW